MKVGFHVFCADGGVTFQVASSFHGLVTLGSGIASYGQVSFSVFCTDSGVAFELTGPCNRLITSNFRATHHSGTTANAGIAFCIGVTGYTEVSFGVFCADGGVTV